MFFRKRPSQIGVTGAILCIKLILVIGLEDGRICSLNKWLSYKYNYGKNYDTSLTENQRRRSIFCENLLKISQHNANKSNSYTMGVNHFSDKTEVELSRVLALNIGNNPESIGSVHRASLSELNNIFNISTKVPAEVDWSKDPTRVSPARNQGDCGACWAFATVGMLEGQEQPDDGESLVRLSEQNLIDCDELDRACDGGAVFQALMEIRRLGGLMSQDDYPYKSGKTKKKHSCQMKKSQIVRSTLEVKPPIWLVAGDEELLKRVVASYGPVAVGIHASVRFHQYRYGIFYDYDCKQEPNHAVLIVGYGTRDGKDYWKVKNSWSAGWGESGFGLMSRNQDNNCQISDQVFISASRIDFGADDPINWPSSPWWSTVGLLFLLLTLIALFVYFAYKWKRNRAHLKNQTQNEGAIVTISGIC